jgi:hypothetical protein
MNELYTQTELIRGRLYRYDPDRDIWYPVPTKESPVSAGAWLAVLVILTIIAYRIEYA